MPSVIGRRRLVSLAVLAAILASLLSVNWSPSPARASALEEIDLDHERHTPITVAASLATPPAVNEQATVTFIVSSSQPAPGTTVTIVTSDGVRVDSQQAFVIDLAADVPQTLTTAVTPLVAGNHSVAANALYELGDGNRWGDSAAVSFHSAEDDATASFTYQGDATSGGAAPGPGNTQQSPTPSFPDGTMDTLKLDDLPPPPVDNSMPGETSSAPVTAEAAAPGTITIAGNTGVYVQSGTWANLKMTVVLFDSTGHDIAATTSGFDGNYSFTVPNPGQFFIRTYTSFYHTSMFYGPIRVVPDGTAVATWGYTEGYHYDVGPFTPSASGTTNIGSWQPDPNWAGHRAWWIYKSILDGFFYPYYNVPPGAEAGSRMPDGVTVEWSPGSTDGAYYRVNTRTINLADIDANSPHTILHEYGHAIMDATYRRVGGAFPTNDCPNPHFVTGAGGTNCSWTEGWADFYPLLVLDDPVYKFGCALPCTPPSIDLENHSAGDYWDDGHFVEGNVAASLWDLVDYDQDGLDVTTWDMTPFWMIWDVFYTQTDNTFSDYWYAWEAAGYNATNVRSSLFQNTINFGWSSCPDWQDEPNERPSQLDGLYAYPHVFALCTDGDADYHMFHVLPGETFTIWTRDLGRASNNTLADTTLTLYGSDGVTQLAYNDDSSLEAYASLIQFTATTEGWHYVAVRHINGRGNFGYTYTLDVAKTSANAAPTVTAPTQRLTSGQTLGNPAAGQYTVGVEERWTATDSDGSIASQQLQQQVNSAGFTALAPALNGTVRSQKVNLTIGTTNQFQVQATDDDGASSAVATGDGYQVLGSQQASSLFTYSGSWSNVSHANAWGGSMKVTPGGAGTQVVYRFYGSQAALIGALRPDGGQAEVYIDGVFRGTLDCYGASNRYRRVLFVVDGLSRYAADGGYHMLELRGLSSHNAASSGTALYLDGAVVLK